MGKKQASNKNKPARKTLKENEFYNSKTKRYEYHYVDLYGKTRVVSSYRLEATDQAPKGKRSPQSLREKEAEISAQLANHLDIEGNKLTLLELVNKYLEFLYDKKKLAINTKNGYRVAVNNLKNFTIAYMEIGKIKPDHCEEWLKQMKRTYKETSIHREISVLKRSFEYAVDHDYVSKNPFKNITASAKILEPKRALTVDEMNRFLDFCKNDPNSEHCYEMIYILFWTGLRVSEFCGLTLDCVDMENRVIKVDKQLQRLEGRHMVIPPKTGNGVRYIPMTDGVYECFQKVLQKRYIRGDVEPTCYDENGEAYSGFVFLASRSRKTMVRSNVSEYLNGCIRRFNEEHPDDPIRKFEAHVCRHTFATNMQGLPPKTLQTILGHGNISTTMDSYVDARPVETQMDEVRKAAKLVG